MKTLMLMRHAKSSWKEPLPDRERPLSGRGRRDARSMGRLLGERAGPPDQVLASSARRAVETARLVAESCVYEGSIEQLDELYGAGPEEMVEALGRVWPGAQTVLLVGHNPGLEEIWQEASGRHDHLPTAAVALLALRLEEWATARWPLRPEVVDLWLPRRLASDSSSER